MTLQVGRSKIEKKNREGDMVTAFFSYMDIPPTEDGWIECDKYLPCEYDLVRLKNGETIKSGWITGSTWDGMKVNDKEKFKYWKKINE